MFRQYSKRASPEHRTVVLLTDHSCCCYGQTLPSLAC
jgi:hypothetical protein